jgi:hypothetical protein
MCAVCTVLGLALHHEQLLDGTRYTDPGRGRINPAPPMTELAVGTNGTRAVIILRARTRHRSDLREYRGRYRPWIAANRWLDRPKMSPGLAAEKLLIRGFGVQVPGGAPVLNWPYSVARGNIVYCSMMSCYR